MSTSGTVILDGWYNCYHASVPVHGRSTKPHVGIRGRSALASPSCSMAKALPEGPCSGGDSRASDRADERSKWVSELKQENEHLGSSLFNRTLSRSPGGVKYLLRYPRRYRTRTSRRCTPTRRGRCVAHVDRARVRVHRRLLATRDPDASGEGFRASLGPPGGRPGPGHGFGHVDGRSTPIVDVNPPPDLGCSDVAFHQQGRHPAFPRPRRND